jgi:hypothetical protein
MFPSPEIDDWYSRLLSVPMVYPIQPPLLHREWDDFTPRSVHPTDEIRCGSSIAIVLESPMVFPLPPGDSELWHHGLLMSDLPDHCPVYGDDGTTPIGAIPLTDVLFEFSPLERVGWERVIDKHEQMQLERGVWIRRTDAAMTAILIDQRFGEGLETIGPIAFRHDAQLRRIVFVPDDPGRPSVPADQIPELAKPIFVALMLLRHLAVQPTLSPTPTLATRQEDGQRAFIVSRSTAAARVLRVDPGPKHCTWFVLRDGSNLEEPFSHVSNPDGGLTIETASTFRDLEVAQLLQSASLR